MSFTPIKHYLSQDIDPFSNLCFMANNNAILTEKFDIRIKQLNHAIDKLRIVDISLIATTAIFIISAVFGSIPTVAIFGTIFVGTAVANGYIRSQKFYVDKEFKDAKKELTDLYQKMTTYLDAQTNELVKLYTQAEMNIIGNKHSSKKKGPVEFDKNFNTLYNVCTTIMDKLNLKSYEYPADSTYIFPFKITLDNHNSHRYPIIIDLFKFKMNLNSVIESKNKLDENNRQL